MACSALTSKSDPLYVPNMETFILITKHHDEFGHTGYKECIKLFKKTYWLPKILRLFAKYVLC